jgi:hypothetical protein
MSEPRGDEKQEKPEKGRDESWDEKWRRDPVEAAVWAIVLIWAGLVWFASNVDFWEDLLGEGTEWWSVGFLGAGVIVLLGVLARIVVPAYRRPLTGSVILGIIFLGIGLGGITEGWIWIGPLVLIAIGVGGFLAFFFRRKE